MQKCLSHRLYDMHETGIKVLNLSSGASSSIKLICILHIKYVTFTCPSVLSEASKNVSTTFYNSDCRSFVIAFGMKR